MPCGRSAAGGNFLCLTGHLMRKEIEIDDAHRSTMPMTVRGYFVLLVIAVVLPALALLAFLVWLNADSQRATRSRCIKIMR